MRLVLAALGVLALAAPAYAEPRPGSVSEDVVDALPHPDDVNRATTRADRTVGALMDVNVGGVVAAVDPDGNPRHHDDTLGDLVTDGDPRARQKIHRDIRMMGAGLNALIARASVMAPALEESLRRVKRDFKKALREPYDHYEHDERYED